MRDVLTEFKALKLFGMAGAWTELADNGSETMLESARWLMEHLLDAEGTDRALRTIRYKCCGTRGTTPLWGAHGGGKDCRSLCASETGKCLVCTSLSGEFAVITNSELAQTL